MQNIINKYLVFIGLTLSVTACGNPQTDPVSDSSYYKTYNINLLWEPAHPEGESWTDFILPLIENELGSSFLQGSDDMNEFCPNYNKFDNHQRAIFWGYLISAMTKYESSFNPTSRMSEPSLGTDRVTKTTVYSEGLLQLSYQDAGWIPTCEISWEKDKHLAANDPKKTILNPQINLNCGIRILANQIATRKRISLSSGAYWAVLIPGRAALTNIKNLTRNMPGCSK